MFIVMILIFVLGYLAIALEHPIKIDKTATAIIISFLLWTVFMLWGESILNLGHNLLWTEAQIKGIDITDFIGKELERHLVDISEILFFLLGAMTIVEVVDQHQGFKTITDKIKSNNAVSLLWIIGILTFFLSSVLDNLTTTIVIIALLRKLIADKKTRWLFAGIVVIAANAGGAWSPIGDVTTIMLWIGGQVTGFQIMKMIFIPSLLNIVVPLTALSFTLKGKIERPIDDKNEKVFTTKREQNIVFAIGIGSLLFAPIFKSLTELPPYMGMLFGLAVLWIVTGFMHSKKDEKIKNKLSIFTILKRIDIPTILFFLGILSAVAALQSAGQLAQLAGWLDNATNNNVYIINIIIGLLSAIIDNVPLVAGAMGMYPIAGSGTFAVDGTFWEFLAYCAGTGGSILIIGSAAGVAAMGLEKIDFIWYMKKISLYALLGYFAGAVSYILLT